jgi:hypothetical protein
MKPQEFFDKYTGKAIDFDGRYGNQCVDSFNQYLKEVLGIGNPIQMFPVMSAYQIWDYGKNNPHFTRIENTPTGIPQEGDIIIWANDKNFPDGHVAIFQSGDVNSFVSFDQNYPMGSLCHFQTHNYTNPKVIGWLRPTQFEITPEPTKPPFIDIVKLWKNMEGSKTYAAVLGMFLTILAYNLGYITEEQFNMFDTLFLALMGFSLRDAIKKK